MSTLENVRQLIYTNVKPELSPTGQGGFQVWRYSKSLEPEHRKAVAKRLGDFKLPPELAGLRPPKPAPGAPPESLENSPLKAAVRHQAYPVAGVGYVVARAVPIAERDEFGRGGRFFAHALILTDEQFAAIDYDPFRVFGANPFPKAGDGFEFWEDVSKGLADLSGGRPPACLPDAVVTPVGLPDAIRLELSDKARIDLLCHLTGKDSKPVVWPAKPADVFQVARSVVRALHRVARQNFSFDTMTNGAALDKEPYPLVGGFSADAVRMWSSRKYHAYEPAAKNFRPPLPKVHHLPGTLLGADGWDALSDADKDAAYKTADAVAGKNTAALADAADLSPAALAVLEAGGTREAVVSILDGKEKDEVPDELARLPGVRAAIEKEKQGGLGELLSRSAKPLDRDRVGEGVLGEFWKPTAPPPDVVQAGARWLAGGPAPTNLHRAVARWRLSDADVKWLLGRIESHPDSSFNKWLADTLPFEMDAVLNETNPLFKTPDRLKEFRLWLALRRAPADEKWVCASLQVAYHGGENELADTFDALYKEPESVELVAYWQTQVLLKIAYESATPGWVRLSDRRAFGLIARVAPPEHTDRVAHVLFVRGNQPKLATDIVAGWRRRKSLTPKKPEPCVANPSSKASQSRALRLCQELLGLDTATPKGRLERTRDELQKELGEAKTPWELQQVIWEFHNRALGFPVLVGLDRGILFAGVEVRSREYTHRSGFLYLFEALAGLMGPRYGDDAAADDRPPQFEANAVPWMFGQIHDALTQYPAG